MQAYLGQLEDWKVHMTKLKKVLDVGGCVADLPEWSLIEM